MFFYKCREKGRRRFYPWDRPPTRTVPSSDGTSGETKVTTAVTQSRTLREGVVPLEVLFGVPVTRG